MPGIKDKYQVSLKAIMKNQDGKVLILCCVPGSKFAQGGFYDVPGGRIDTDEFKVPFVDILKREIVEELGDIAIQIHGTPVGVGRHTAGGGDSVGTHVLQLFFAVDYIGEDIMISDEHAGYEWIDLHAIDLEKYFTSGILEGMKMYLGK